MLSWSESEEAESHKRKYLYLEIILADLFILEFICCLYKRFMKSLQLLLEH